jgi:drug/metabolite transporter (DMT)-like permease
LLGSGSDIRNLMLVPGILYGLLASAGQSISFVFSRRFIVNGHGDPVRLLALGHVMMGIAAAALLAVVWDSTQLHVDLIAFDAFWASATYLLGQVFFFAAIRSTAVSRISPLLGLKVAAVAPLSIWLLGAQITAIQWLAIAMSMSGGFMLNRIGGRLPVATIGSIVIAVFLFALSDIYIIKLVEACGDGMMASIRAVCVAYAMCGLAGFAMLSWCGSRLAADWRAAVPYAAIWLPSMFGLFAALAMCGPVLGNIVLATRGLFSIGLGVLLARGGLHHLEQHVSRDVLLRRTAAAVLMIAAIGLFAWAAR